MSLHFFNVYVVYFLCLALFVVLVAKWKRLPNALRSFALYCLFMAVFQMIAPYILRTYGENVSYYNFVIIVYTALIYLTFRSLLKSTGLKRIVDVLGCISVLGLAIMSFVVFGDPIAGFQLWLAHSILIALLGLIYFYDLLKNVSQKSLFKRWDFILVGAFFFYNLASVANKFLIWVSLKMDVNVGQANNINLVLYDIELIFFTYAVWLFLRELREKDKGRLQITTE